MVHPGSMCVRLAVDTVDDLEEFEGPVWHGQCPVRMKKQRQRARESEAKGHAKGQRSVGRSGGGFIVRQEVCSACCKMKGDSGC